MEGRQRRSFTDDYKRQAVDLVASSGRSVGSVAKELGLRDSVLRRWVERHGAGREPTAASRRPTTQAALPSAVAGLTARVETANPSPRILVLRNAGADGDRADMDVSVIDVPAVLAFGIATAGEGGHGP
jgi:transposase